MGAPIRNFSSYLTALRILFLSIAAGMIFMAVAIVFATGRQPSLEEVTGSLSHGQVPWAALAGFLALSVLSRWLHLRLAARARQHEHLVDKLQAFRTACIVAWALWEGGVFLLIVHYFVSGATASLAIAAVGIAFFLSRMPTRDWVERSLELTEQEKAALA